MVTKAYMLDKPPGPSEAQRWLDQVLVPGMVNAVAPVEAALYRVSDRARRAPLTALGAALACGYLLRGLTAPRGRRGLSGS